MPRVREHRGVLFLALRPSNRLAIATTIERLIEMLDAAEADPDFEPALGGYSGPGDDRESADDERLFGSGFGTAGCEDDEPALGWTLEGTNGPHASYQHQEDEPSLGWPEGFDQERRCTLAEGIWHDDGEEDGGDMPEDDGETFGSSGAEAEDVKKLEDTAEALILFHQLTPEEKAVALEFARSLLGEQNGEARQ